MTIPAYIKYLEKHDPALLPFAMKVIREEPNIKDVHHIENLAEILYAESDSGKKISTADMVDDYLEEQGITLEQLYAEEQKEINISEQIVKNEREDFLNTPVRADIFDVVLAEADEPVTPRKIKHEHLERVKQMNNAAKALAKLDGIDAEIIDNFNGMLMIRFKKDITLLSTASKLFGKLAELSDFVFYSMNPIDEISKFSYGIDHLYEE